MAYRNVRLRAGLGLPARIAHGHWVQWTVRKVLRPLLERISRLDGLLLQRGLRHLNCADATLDNPPTFALQSATPAPAPPAAAGAWGSSPLGGNMWGAGGAYGVPAAAPRVPTKLVEWQQMGVEVRDIVRRPLAGGTCVWGGRRR